MQRFAVNLAFLTMLCQSSVHAGEVQTGEERMTSARSAAKPVWSRAVDLPASPPARIVVEGTITNDGFQPSAVRFPETKPAPPVSRAMMPGRNILPLLDVRPFGLEERVEHYPSPEGLAMHCSPGRHPAGLVLSTDSFHLPRGIRFELIVTGDPTGDIGLSIVRQGADAPANPMTILRPERTALAAPIASWSERPQPNDVVLSCPLGPAEALIRSIMNSPEPSPGAESETGTWVWQPDNWIGRPAAVTDLAEKAGLGRVYLQLRIDDGTVAERRALAALIERLGRKGVAVHAVEGDPEMATEDGRTNALARVAAIARYQATALPAERLTGLQFDIEPYLLETYARDSAAAWRGWGESIKMLAQAWGSPVSVVVPFWMLGEEAGLAAMETVRGAISQVVVMAYRTAPDEVFALGEPWLAWGTARDVPVAIALENGPLPVELHKTYVRAETGPLVLTYGQRAGRVALLFDHVRASDDELVYALSHETQVDPSRISFMNDRRQLSNVRSRLSHLFGAWSSFDGIMLHELGETDGEIQKPVNATEGKNG